MKEYLLYGDTLSDAYHRALTTLHYCGDITDCADWNTRQKELAMTMVIQYPLREPMISKCFIGGPEELQQYVMEMLDGILDFEVDKGNWTYTYHQRMTEYPSREGYLIDQISFVVNELKRNPSSRRAVMFIRSVDDIGSDDPACLQHIQYFIRNGKLDCSVLFRSNDAAKATFMNAFALIMLQKRIADELGIKVGTYTHRANSFHCYEKDWELLHGYAWRIDNAEDKEDITYEYDGDWKDFMDEAIPEIMEKVETLKNNDKNP